MMIDHCLRELEEQAEAACSELMLKHDLTEDQADAHMEKHGSCDGLPCHPECAVSAI
jgi:hypothetical protein